MLSFHYTFKTEIKNGKTFKNVTDTVQDSFTERDVNNITIENNVITGKDKLFKLDFSQRSPLVISPGKEYFIYEEDTGVLTYKIEAFYSILFNMAYAGILFLILYNFVHHWIIELVIPFLFFIFITAIEYFQYQAVLNKISGKLNETRL